MPPLNDGFALHVIMPAKNVEDLVEDAVRSILPQLQAGDGLTVVDDSSQDRTAELAEQAGSHVLTLHESVGPYAARNRAAAEVATPGMVFVDARCRARGGWLESHRRMLSDGAGYTYTDIEILDLRTVASRVARGWDFFDARQHLRSPLGPFFPTANLGVRTELFRAVGGFDETRSGADAQICRQLARHGASYAVDFAARMEWVPRRELGQLKSQFQRYGISAAELALKNGPARPVLMHTATAPLVAVRNSIRLAQQYPGDMALQRASLEVQWVNELAFYNGLVKGWGRRRKLVGT